MLTRDFCEVLRYELLIDKYGKSCIYALQIVVMVIMISFGQISISYLLTTLIPKWKVYKLLLVVPQMIYLVAIFRTPC